MPAKFWHIKETSDKILIAVPESATSQSGLSLVDRNCRKSTPLKIDAVDPVFEISNFDFSGFEPRKLGFSSSGGLPGEKSSNNIREPVDDVFTGSVSGPGVSGSPG